MKVKSVLRTIFVYVYTSSAIFFLNNCVSPDPILDLAPEEKDLYITNRDPNVNFADYKTYAIVDSVRMVNKSSVSIQGGDSSNTFILNAVNAQLQKDGFVKVDTSQHPDVGISVSILQFSEDVPVAYYNYTSAVGFYGYVPPSFYGFPGYGYGIPSNFGYYTIVVGTISIEMFDLKTARANPVNHNLNLVWSAVLVGSLASGTVSNDRILHAINGAFDQSPYLKDGK